MAARRPLRPSSDTSLAPYNTEAEVDRFLEAVEEIACGRINARYEQAEDGEYAPAGGWPRVEVAL